MKSKITIDFNEDNTPVIRINYEHSEDVRDKWVRRFLETISESPVVRFSYTPWQPEGNASQSEIIPIKPQDLRHQLQPVIAWLDHRDEQAITFPPDEV